VDVMMINSLHEQKLSLLEQFGEFTLEQLRLLEAGKYEEILTLFEKKDILIKMIDELDKQLDFAPNPEELLEKLKELQALNKQLEEKLNSTKTAIGEKLIELQQGKQSKNMYQHYIQTEGAFIDKRQ